MTYIGTSDFGVDAARGQIGDVSTVNKFGAATDCDSGVATDVWDGADGSTSTKVFVPPTTARIHAIASTSANDAAAGTGMQQITVYGIPTDWNQPETSEDVTMNGTTPVNTVNSYVMIHRMQKKAVGSGGTNAGIITATAATDSTVTAAILAGNRQTLMAIYGIPSGKKLLLNRLVCTALRSVAVNVDGSLLVDDGSAIPTGGFNVKENFIFTRESPFVRDFYPPKLITGPAIVKVQVTTDANNITCTAAFDGFVVDV